MLYMEVNRNSHSIISPHLLKKRSTNKMKESVLCYEFNRDYFKLSPVICLYSMFCIDWILEQIHIQTFEQCKMYKLKLTFFCQQTNVNLTLYVVCDKYITNRNETEENICILLLNPIIYILYVIFLREKEKNIHLYMYLIRIKRFLFWFRNNFFKSSRSNFTSKKCILSSSWKYRNIISIRFLLDTGDGWNVAWNHIIKYTILSFIPPGLLIIFLSNCYIFIAWNRRFIYLLSYI